MDGQWGANSTTIPENRFLTVLGISGLRWQINVKQTMGHHAIGIPLLDSNSTKRAESAVEIVVLVVLCIVLPPLVGY